MSLNLRTPKGGARILEDPLLREIDKALELGLRRGSAVYVGAVKRSISRPGPRKSPRTKAELRRIAAAGETIRPSRPGEPPRKRTGTLRNSTTYQQVSRFMFHAGYATTALYGAILEFWMDRQALRMAFVRNWLSFGGHSPMKDAILGPLRRVKVNTVRTGEAAAL